jgi:hypothetical protein
VWIKPGYTPDRPDTPRDQGERLATFTRSHGEELRVTREHYQGQRAGLGERVPDPREVRELTRIGGSTRRPGQW